MYEESTAMAWFVKIEEGIVDKAVFDRYVPAHLAFVQELIDRGCDARTGYWAQRGGGMLLFQADSMEEAQMIIAQDPLVQNHCVNYKLYEWNVVKGETLACSSDRVQPPETPRANEARTYVAETRVAETRVENTRVAEPRV
jgi:uncharacterized protein YciI